MANSSDVSNVQSYIEVMSHYAATKKPKVEGKILLVEKTGLDEAKTLTACGIYPLVVIIPADNGKTNYGESVQEALCFSNETPYSIESMSSELTILRFNPASLNVTYISIEGETSKVISKGKSEDKNDTMYVTEDGTLVSLNAHVIQMLEDMQKAASKPLEKKLKPDSSIIAASSN